MQDMGSLDNKSHEMINHPHPNTRVVWLVCDKGINNETNPSRRGKLDSLEASLPQPAPAWRERPEYFLPKQAARHRQRQQHKLPGKAGRGWAAGGDQWKSFQLPGSKDRQPPKPLLPRQHLFLPAQGTVQCKGGSAQKLLEVQTPRALQHFIDLFK